MYVEPLRALGVALRGLPLVVDEPAPYADGLEAVKAAAAAADVILWHHWETDWACRDCEYTTRWEALARNHAARTRHGPFPTDLILRRLWSDLGPRRAGVMFDTDHWITNDSMWWAPAWLRDVMAGWRYPIETADLLTCSTPRLAGHCRRFNPRVQVLRNSIDVTQYVPDQPWRKDHVRLVSYAVGGVPERLSDWIGPAQAAAKDHRARLRTVFLGANGPAETADLHAAGFDEVRPAVDFRAWPRALANTWPEIGVSPLRPSPYNACRSEQHWLEYAALGCPTVAQRGRGGGPSPYSGIREGVDGLLARGRQEWSDAIGRLARSPQLRADIGGRARERVLAEYNPTDRAQELADALRWAAEHAGIGRRQA